MRTSKLRESWETTLKKKKKKNSNFFFCYICLMFFKRTSRGRVGYRKLLGRYARKRKKKMNLKTRNSSRVVPVLCRLFFHHRARGRVKACNLGNASKQTRREHLPRIFTYTHIHAHSWNLFFFFSFGVNVNNITLEKTKKRVTLDPLKVSSLYRTLLYNI